jgi:hypothetical protein
MELLGAAMIVAGIALFAFVSEIVKNYERDKK